MLKVRFLFFLWFGFHCGAWSSSFTLLERAERAGFNFIPIISSIVVAELVRNFTAKVIMELSSHRPRFVTKRARRLALRHWCRIVFVEVEIDLDILPSVLV